MAGRIGRLDEAHCVGDGAGASGADEDQRRSVAAVAVGADSVLGRH